MIDKRTKQDRMIALFDAYKKLHGTLECTTSEVADWAIRNGLYPAPGRRESREYHARWNERFAEVTGNFDW